MGDVGAGPATFGAKTDSVTHWSVCEDSCAVFEELKMDRSPLLRQAVYLKSTVGSPSPRSDGEESDIAVSEGNLSYRIEEKGRCTTAGVHCRQIKYWRSCRKKLKEKGEQ